MGFVMIINRIFGPPQELIDAEKKLNDTQEIYRQICERGKRFTKRIDSLNGRNGEGPECKVDKTP